MRIDGKWLKCEDGATRPVAQVLVEGLDGQTVTHKFLIDSCSDCTVLSASLLRELNLPTKPAPSGLSLQGISGAGNYVAVSTVIEFLRVAGGPARIRGDMAAFTDPTATDVSILGRDVLDHFDVILSRRRGEILLLAGNHEYHVA